MKRDVFFDRQTALVNEFRKANDKDKPEILKRILRLERFRTGLMEFCKLLRAKTPS